MQKKKIYISGQISGLTRPEYVANFLEAARLLNAQGYDVVNPLFNGVDATQPWQVHMKADIKLLLDCDAIYMLPNWEVSNGATLEREIAKTLGLEIVYERQPQHRDIKRAILTVMSVPFKTIAADSRERWHVYARMIYAHHCKKRGVATQEIAEETKHDASTIHYYLRRYDSEYKYNREFRAAAEKVATLLSKKLTTPPSVSL
jgi:hypothetical protein|nr:MAG TPA: hypothetical protein [Caudoviricetes sp.]